MADPQPGLIHGISYVETEHGYGMHGRAGFVVLRVTLENGDVAHTQIPPDDARHVANGLLDNAARAEYEADLVHHLEESDATPALIGGILTGLRHHQVAREIAKETK